MTLFVTIIHLSISPFHHPFSIHFTQTEYKIHVVKVILLFYCAAYSARNHKMITTINLDLYLDSSTMGRPACNRWHQNTKTQTLSAPPPSSVLACFTINRTAEQFKNKPRHRKLLPPRVATARTSHIYIIYTLVGPARNHADRGHE